MKKNKRIKERGKYWCSVKNSKSRMQIGCRVALPCLRSPMPYWKGTETRVLVRRVLSRKIRYMIVNINANVLLFTYSLFIHIAITIFYALLFIPSTVELSNHPLRIHIFYLCIHLTEHIWSHQNFLPIKVLR